MEKTLYEQFLDKAVEDTKAVMQEGMDKNVAIQIFIEGVESDLRERLK